MKTIYRYIRFNWLFSAFVGYELFACALKLTTNINITIPCLYTTIFGFHCPGCGLTSALIELLKLNPYSAWDHNPLIFILIPGVIIYLILDVKRFNKRKSKPVFSN